MKPAITFRPVTEADFPLLTGWLNEPHMRAFYQPKPVTLAEVVEEYGPAARGEEPSLLHIAELADHPFGYLQCYANSAYPEWAEIIGFDHGVSIDLYIGEPDYLRRGLGQAMLATYVRDVVATAFPDEDGVYIGHETANAAALACSKAAGFEVVGSFMENGKEMMLLKHLPA